MTLRFLGGPYDGMTMLASTCEQVSPPISITTERGERKLIAMPAPEDWPRVLKGLAGVHDSDGCHYYEVTGAPSSRIVDGGLVRCQDATYRPSI